MLDLNKEAYLQAIRERQKCYRERLCSGAWNTFEEGKALVAKINGLEEAILVINKIYQHVLAGREITNEIIINHIGGINS